MVTMLVLSLLTQTPTIRRATPAVDDPGMVVRQVGPVTVTGSVSTTAVPPDGGVIGYLMMPDGGPQEVTVTGSVTVPGPVVVNQGNGVDGGWTWDVSESTVYSIVLSEPPILQGLNASDGGTAWEVYCVNCAWVPDGGAIGTVGVTGNVAITAAALPLPALASTSTLQTTGNTSVASIDTKTPALGQAAMAASSPVVIASNQSAVPVSGTVGISAGVAVIGHVIADTGSTTAVTGNVAVTNAGLTNIDVALSTRTKPADQQHTIIDSSASIAVTGPLTDAQIRATPLPVSGTVTANAGTGTMAVSIATAPALVASSAIIGNVRIDQTTPGTTNAVQANAGTNLNTSLLALEATQTNRTAKSVVTDGTRDATVKAASTAAVAADTALVVAISPNNAVALAAGAAVIGHVIADTGSTTAVTGNVTVVQPTGTNLHAVLDATSTTAVTQATGTNLHAVIDTGSTTAVTGNVTVVQGTGTNLHTVVDTLPTLVAGTALIGKVGIDQTTPGTTNAVSAVQNGTWTVQPGNTPNTSPWLVNDVPRTVASANNAGVCVSVTASTTVLASNASRKAYGFKASEDNTAKVHCKLGATATTGNMIFGAGAGWSQDTGAVYTGVIDCIAASGTQSVCPYELN